MKLCDEYAHLTRPEECAMRDLTTGWRCAASDTGCRARRLDRLIRFAAALLVLSSIVQAGLLLLRHT